MGSVNYRKPFLYVVTRDRWKALPAVSSERLVHPVERLFVLYTGHNQCRNKKECKEVMRQMQKKAMDEGHPDILYNFCIGGDARVYEGRGWSVKVDRPDVLDWKDGSLVLGYIGRTSENVDTEEFLITRGYKFLRYGVQKRYLISHIKTYDRCGILPI